MTAIHTGKDAIGRPYATVADTKAGDVLIADGGFVSDINGQDGHCITSFTEVTVQQNGKGDLFVPCAHGQHCLDGQIETTADGVQFYMGLYPKGA